MRRRILRAIAALCVLGLLGFGLPLAFAVRRLYVVQAELGLQRVALEAAGDVPRDFQADPAHQRINDPGRPPSLGLYEPSGRRLNGVGPRRADQVVVRALRGSIAYNIVGETLVAAVPITTGGTVHGAVRAQERLTAVESRTRRTWGVMALLAIAVLTGTAVVASRVAGRLSRPVFRLAETAQQLGEGDFSVRAPPSGIAEVDRAAVALAQAADRIADLVARERAFSSDASHQLRTPLTAVRVHIESELATPSADRDAALSSILRDVDRLQATVEDLLALARDIAPPREALDVNTVLRDVVEHARRRLPSGRSLNLTMDDDLPEVHASPAAIHHVLAVMVENAIEHGGGDIEIRARDAAGGLAVDVANHSDRIIDDREAIFARRSGPQTGRGIGLALARSLAEAEGGRLLLTEAGPAVRFTLHLPGRPRGGPILDRAVTPA